MTEETAMSERSAAITSRYCECQTPEECDHSSGCKRHYTNTKPQSAAHDRWPDGSADECPKCGFLHAYDRSCEDQTPACVCGEINMRHCPVHGNQPTHDWFSVQAGFWRTLWLVLRGGRLREWKWLTGDEVRASGVYLSAEEFFASLEETT